MKLDATTWNLRYQNNETGWDIGYASTPLVSYFQSLNDKNIDILIPGGGNGHEVTWLFEHGFNKVHLLDWAPEPLQRFAKKYPNFPTENLICSDFFEHQGQYDLIVEQTFFCAIDPALRKQYVNKIQELLKPGGKLAGVMFGVPLNDDHPPFGGSLEEYQKLFADQFTILHMEPCSNSIAPRMGNELFVEMTKK